jgi:hypothetical protein
MQYYTPNEAERRLIDALRSGEYEQGTGKLRIGNKYCCLGVACQTTKVPLEEIPSYGGSIWGYVEAGIAGAPYDINYLPQAVRRELGWRWSTGMTEIPGDDEWISLASLNDAGFTFNQIADIIEAGLVRKENE